MASPHVTTQHPTVAAGTRTLALRMQPPQAVVPITRRLLEDTLAIEQPHAEELQGWLTA